LKSEVDKLGEVNTSNVRQTVISIRESKLPDPAKVGNAGSFFKNPIVSNDFANRLKTTFKDLPVYASSEEQTKLAAGWLIEKCGWKGFREGDVGVHPNQALVIVNYGNAKGEQLVHLSTQIKNSVFEKFGVQLDTEVNII
jgi:UDP-N-acetylmuramate dehydrogenase